MQHYRLHYYCYYHYCSYYYDHVDDWLDDSVGMTIQEGEHDPGIDARTAMELYKLRLIEW